MDGPHPAQPQPTSPVAHINSRFSILTDLADEPAVVEEVHTLKAKIQHIPPPGSKKKAPSAHKARDKPVNPKGGGRPQSSSNTGGPVVLGHPPSVPPAPLPSCTGDPPVRGVHCPAPPPTSACTPPVPLNSTAPLGKPPDIGTASTSRPPDRALPPSPCTSSAMETDLDLAAPEVSPPPLDH